ncbi:MAG: response regulator [Mucilaginibacter sp.]|jgi:DNA-binding response OmpR family regulator|nr:response regulator [Mucilaginibacter sp.]MDB5111590.1 response regulator [Mucilaginibacter sp.]
MKKNILVIDDDEEVLSILEEILIYSNFEVKGMNQPDNLLRVITEFRPDLVLMDYRLSGVNGGEICRQLKSDQNLAYLPVVLISSYPSVMETFGDYGCDAFIAKPFGMNELINCVNQCIA